MQNDQLSKQPLLVTLSPDCFVPKSDNWNDVRGFLLSIFLWHNDIVSIIKLDDFIETLKPINNNLPTIQQGEYGGLRSYLDRLYASTLNEFLSLIRKNNSTVRSANWLKVEEKLETDEAQNWKYLKEFAHGNVVRSEIYEPLVKLRSHVGFHYDPKQLFTGYRSHLERKDISPEFQKAFVKSGNSGNRIRFYLADAAAQAYYKSIINITEDRNENGPWAKLIELLPNVTASLFRSFLEIKRTSVTAY